MKIGILREEKIPADKRVAFSPAQCRRILNDYPNIEIQVQSSDIRCFKDNEYADLGISVLMILVIVIFYLELRKFQKRN